MTFTVSDGSLSDAETITITVDEVNVVPVLAAIGNKTVKELTELTFTVAVTDADLPANALTYSLVNAPAGATIGAATGAFTWTPIEGQGLGGLYVYHPGDGQRLAGPVGRRTDHRDGHPIRLEVRRRRPVGQPHLWTVSGSFSATHQLGGGVQSVDGGTDDKSRRTRLEHAWTFDVTGGDVGVSFHVLAGHNSTKETFRFEYDVQDGLGWRALVTLTANATTSYSAHRSP